MSPTADRLAKLEARRAALDLKIRAAATKERERTRREDTRMKIVIGGALIALARRDAVSAKAFADQVRPLIAERDRDALTAWLSSVEPDGWAFLDKFAAKEEAGH